MSRVVRVLVVDDSAFVRKTVREMLSRNPYIEVVGAARDGGEALELVEQLRPDVVTCDLNMPRVDGVEFVRRQMGIRALPILLLSSAEEDAAQAMAALDAGAIDFVRKPTALANDDLLRIKDELVEKVKAVARVTLRSETFHSGTDDEKLRSGPAAAGAAAPQPGIGTAGVEAVVIGISTGGPQALRVLIPRLPKDFAAPLAVVLHMPLGFTALFASKLAEVSQLEVREAVEGDEFCRGRVLLAQAGKHMTLVRRARGQVVAHLSRQPSESLHRPSVDVLFRSAAEVFGERVLGVVMTGMGSDGREGAAWIKSKGGSVITEAEESCVIYGMPRSVAEAGLSDAAVPLSRMASAMMERI
jgi:two-component system chemotaxis response regulator CheB